MIGYLGPKQSSTAPLGKADIATIEVAILIVRESFCRCSLHGNTSFSPQYSAKAISLLRRKSSMEGNPKTTPKTAQST